MTIRNKDNRVKDVREIWEQKKKLYEKFKQEVRRQKMKSVTKKLNVKKREVKGCLDTSKVQMLNHLYCIGISFEKQII